MRFGFSILLVASSSIGVTQLAQNWVARVNGPGNGLDIAMSVEVASDGSVFVGGGSQGSGTGQDFLLVKYSPTGSQTWTYRYNGSGGGDDQIDDIALDSLGNVYMAGYSSGLTTGLDFVVVKVNSAGVEQWVHRYSSTNSFSEDLPRSLHVDPATGACYVAGYVTTSGSQNFAVLKVNPNGTFGWDFIFDRAGFRDEAASVWANGSGVCYATGFSTAAASGRDMTTVKLTALGALDRIAHYNNAALNNSDEAYEIVVDPSGNATIAGYSAQSSVLTDMFVVKYDGTLSQLWTARYNGPGNGNDYGFGIARDPYGNLLVVGTSAGSGSGFDAVAQRYSSGGTLLGTSRYNGPGNQEDGGMDIAVDPVGNSYVVGYSAGSGTFWDFVLIKHNSNLTQQAVFRYNGPIGADDSALSVGLNANGIVAMAGWSNGSGSGMDFATVAFNQNFTLSGSLTLENYTGSLAGLGVTVSLSALGGDDIVWTGQTSLNAAGAYSIQIPYTGGVDVRTKVSHWLRKLQSDVQVPVGGVSGVNFILVNGDVNGDNSVNVADFLALRAAFGSTSSSGNWNPNADLNGSGSVNVQDFLILRNNFGRTGD